jgi:hypothetical protein
MYYIRLNKIGHLSLPFPKQNLIPVGIFVSKQVLMRVCTYAGLIYKVDKQICTAILR